MSNYKQEDLLFPSIMIIGKYGGQMDTTTLISELMVLLSPDGSDLESYNGRNDTIFSQTVRNLRAHIPNTKNLQKYFDVAKGDDGIKLSDYGLNMYEMISSYSCDRKLMKKIEMSSFNGNFSFISALLTKPFLLLAGISGTGKSRIVRELARSCWKPDSEEFKAHKPSNFEMIQVKPNWHDSSELLGYVSRISGKPEFVAGDFLRFIVKAWENRNVPCFLCLDEMNLAPVEQYFAEYLSVVETRKLENDEIVTDPILKVNAEQWYIDLIHRLTSDEALSKQFLEKGIAIPQNLFVVGTVNMDETTFSFSRKVLDRAMTIEMNEVDLEGGLENDGSDGFGYIGEVLHAQFVEGKDVYSDNKELCDNVIVYLKSVNEKLEGTPFKIAYRTRNEFLVYAVNRWLLSDGQDVFLNVIDEMTSMKILSRIEGDADKVGSVLDDLKSLLEGAFGESELKTSSVSLSKLKEMKKKLEKTQYTSFWL